MSQHEPDAIEGTAREPTRESREGVYDPREHDEQLDDDEVARELGHDSFADAPQVVQNMIENREITVEDPHAPLRRRDG